MKQATIFWNDGQVQTMTGEYPDNIIECMKILAEGISDENKKMENRGSHLRITYVILHNNGKPFATHEPPYLTFTQKINPKNNL